jgi:hypothetical protein
MLTPAALHCAVDAHLAANAAAADCRGNARLDAVPGHVPELL